MAVKDIQDADVLDGLKDLLGRAALLGLIPEKGAQISARGEFIVEPSNIEKLEEKKMRGYRPKNYPKAMHAWPEGEAEPQMLVVKNAAEEQNAIAVGWSPEPVHGPGGRLIAGVAEPEPEPEEVRTFAAPGAKPAVADTKDVKREAVPAADKPSKAKTATKKGKQS